ncbi:cation diffusion facilitator family transporter [Beutenbergia cavernae DSM 12333]|uniref:Cation diffusion facilitator family transporter n=1 Tax=Beutenbergia cavernae (strain ATCC BAA-8 / DSM 12333 / CCUG 43141 / JCM 11478 / NBRC 16432 / NCIMB 13614 / HKI 0122) TaxID=471853 RepID=C5C1L4_BEUC1|nr:cation diffusion facilitator family transporter [Beutenbergia cavernae]ACQ79482.1 cation diffusion facilitator family transporter [Beutenbergia cavernae DSM 12333]
MSTQGGTRAIVAALLANTGIAITKFIAYLLTQSSSMLAESVHSVADAGNQLLLLLGGKRAQRAADSEHPFGYGRSRYFYAFLVAVILFSVGGLFALYEAYEKFFSPHPIEGRWWWVPLAVLVIAIGMESFSLRTAVHEALPHKGTQSWWGFIRTSKSPELPVVLLEDIGALLGLVFAMFGVSMTLLTHDGRWDAVGSAAIGLLLITIAIVLALETKSLLLGEAASKRDLDAVRAALVGEGVTSVIHLKTQHIGPEELLVAAKIEVPAASSAADVARAIDAAEARVRDAVPIARAIYLEPDLRRAVDAAAAPGGEPAEPAGPAPDAAPPSSPPPGH